MTSGTLEQMLDAGYEYAFLSNSDNLGAVLEPRILAWLAAEEIPFLMEVTRKTEADRKGGHPARQKESGQLILRETAQTPDEDMDSFRDIDRWTHVNTNNLWVNLRRLAEVLREREGVLGLPMIVNKKTADPSDDASPEVFQLETAMGAALGVIEGARVLSVPRTRFAPVKTTDDLLVLRSDAYVLTEDFHVALAPEREDGAPFVELDPKHYKRLRDFDARFPDGPPSLVGAERFVVEGDVRFGRDVVARGQGRGPPGGRRPARDRRREPCWRVRSSSSANVLSTNSTAKMIVQRSRLRSMSEPPTLLPPPVPTPKAPDMPASFPECRRIRKIRPTAMKTWTTESTVYIG